MSINNKPIEEWTMDELNATGFDAFQQREQAINRVRELEQIINTIALEKQRRQEPEEQAGGFLEE